jgi:hypothetical protein
VSELQVTTVSNSAQFTGRFILNNYKQALAIITDYTGEVEHFLQIYGYTTANLLAWREEELVYLQSLTKESDADVLAMSYVEALEFKDCRVSLCSNT